QLTAKMTVGSQVRSFVLPPSQGDHYRLVLDLLPGNGADKAVAAPIAVAKPASATVAASPPAVATVSGRHGGKTVGMSRQITQQAAALLDGQRKVVVCIDAGHGGKDPGSHGPDGTLEKNVTLAVAREHDADLFVSIHADAFTSGDARGSSVWVLSSRGKSSVAARMLADRENSSDLIGGVSLDDKSDGLAKVLLD